MKKENEKQYNDLLEKINIAEEKATEDGKKVLERHLKKVDKNQNLDELYSIIIKIKHNYLFSLKSDYYLLKKYSNRLLITLQTTDNEKLSTYAVSFYKNNNIYKHKIEVLFDKLATEVYKCKKAELLYLASNNLIQLINNGGQYSIKLPLIDNFELDVYNTLSNKITKYEGIIKKDLEEYKKIANEKLNESKKLIKIEHDYSLAISKRRNLEMELDSTKKYNLNLIDQLKKKDYTPVSQFDDTYWGDNYPSLKVLFNFLQVNVLIEVNWSHFASLMSIGNVEPIHLYTHNFTKNEIGYLLKKINIFFNFEYRNRVKRYNGWLSRKIMIDNKQLDDAYISKYVILGNKSTIKPKFDKSRVNNLCTNIGSRNFD